MHLSRLGLLVHLVASLPWWHPSTSALPWHGSILGVLMHLAGAARTSAMGVAGIGVHLVCDGFGGCCLLAIGGSCPRMTWHGGMVCPAYLVPCWVLGLLGIDQGWHTTCTWSRRPLGVLRDGLHPGPLDAAVARSMLV